MSETSVVTPVSCGQRWHDIAGTALPEHEIMRIKAYLDGMGEDDLVYTDYYSPVVGGFDEGEVEQQLVVVGEDGAGRRLRRRDFKVAPNELLEDVASVYLCTCKDTETGAVLKYVFVDCHDDDKPKLVSRRDSFISVFRALKVGISGSVWKGEQLVDAEQWTKLDETEFLFADGLLAGIEENSANFFKGEPAALLTKWGVPPRRGLLLHGKPGNGKTILGRIAAKRSIEAGINVVFLDVKNLGWNMSLGDHLRLAASRSPVIIIVDDIDIHCGRRIGDNDGSGASKERQRFLAELLEFLDGVEPQDGYVLLATTNSLEQLDDALLRAGRLDVHIEVGGPPPAHRKELLERSVSFDGLSTPDVSTAVRLLEGCSYADIAELVRRYKIAVVAKHRTIAVDSELFESVTRRYAQDVGLLETTES